MSGKCGYNLKKASQMMALFSLIILSSCAGSETSQDAAPEAAISDAALLDDADKAMPVVEPGAGVDVFSDLKSDENIAKNMTTTMVNDSSSPFYNPIGGESLGRVAYTLYGDRKQTKTLMEKNPDLKKVKSLTSDQIVYFDFNNVNPEPTYLTKGLLDRYAAQLAEKVSSKSMNKSDVVVAAGESLQMVSQRLYGTTRYWTEIYLLNHDKLNSYDKVQAGMSLTVYERSGDGLVKAGVEMPGAINSPPAVPSQGEGKKLDNSNKSHASFPAVPPEAPVALDPVETMDPMSGQQTTSETNAVPITNVPPPPPPPLAQKTTDLPKSGAAHSDVAEGFSASIAGNTNYRRMLYLGLIILIAGAAFMLTRPARKKKFDMLDATTTETTLGRAKLPKDNHDQSAG